MGYKIATYTLGPILYVQGRQVREALPRLPEPPGDRVGEVGTGPGLRLLVAGDASAAGVGAATQDEALLGRLVHRLSPSWCVQWRLVARTGAKTTNIFKQLQRLDAPPFDVAVTARGVAVRLGTFHEHRARELYRRLGFQECGRSETHIFLAWQR